MDKHKVAVIFDGDDTLWQTQILYDQAKEAFYDLLESQGFDRCEVAVKLDEIDVANVQKLGFSTERFPLSMKETYEHFCHDSNQPIDATIEQEALRIGYQVFEQVPEMMSGAENVLAQLQPLVDLILYSGGDVSVQERKLELLGLRRYFRDTYIVEQKDEDELAALMRQEDLDASSTWMIGNSLRSDINPALRLGLRCIWVHSHSWAYDREELLPGHVWEVTELREILPIVLSDRQQAIRWL